MDSRLPATPESPSPMPNINGCRRLVSIPTSCAPVGDCISARTPLPSSVMRSNTIRAPLNSSASANTSSLLPANCACPSFTGSVR